MASSRPSRPSVAPEGLAYAVTGSVAAQFDAPFAPSRLLTAYVADPDQAAEVLDLRPTDGGANVVLAANNDSFAVPGRTRE